MKRTMVFSCAVLGCAAMFGAVSARADQDTDKTFLSNAAQSDVNEIKLSELAESKGSSPAVKKFAQKMVTDHEALEAKMKPFADQWGLTPPTSPDSDHQAVYDQLNGLSGADFDKAYMAAMDKDHHKALDMFKAEEASTTDPKFKTAVAHGEQVVAQHTTMADKLSGQLGAPASGL